MRDVLLSYLACALGIQLFLSRTVSPRARLMHGALWPVHVLIVVAMWGLYGALQVRARARLAWRAAWLVVVSCVGSPRHIGNASVAVTGYTFALQLRLERIAAMMRALEEQAATSIADAAEREQHRAAGRTR